MNEIKEFDDSEWIVTEDGICQVVGSQKYYIENFFKADFGELNVGDVFENKVVYKIFCGFDGKPRKSQFFKYMSSIYCDSIAKKYLKIRDLSINNNAVMYERFQDRKPNKPITGCIDFSIRVDPKNRDLIVKEINKLFEQFEGEFDFAMFESTLYNQVDGLITKSLSMQTDVMNTNVLIGLRYNVLETKNRKFSFVGGVAVKTYCASDEH